MKRFTHRNESFTCAVCGHENIPAESTCRNHCVMCLCSKHVDINPGDRNNSCQGILKPIGVELKSGLPEKICFKCEVCDFTGRNKIAPDDSREKVYEIMEKSAYL